MAIAFSIDPAAGTICIGDAGLLNPNQGIASVKLQVAAFLAGSRNLGDGYEWLDLRGLSFGGQPAALSLCFHEGRLDMASWSVQLPNAPMDGGWPTREAIDAEVSFVRDVLANEMSLRTGVTPWGAVWSCFDPKGFLASNGLRYRPA